MSWSGPSFTPVDFPSFPDKILYEDTITMIGSCFAEHISSRLDRFKYTVLQNPFGILYNPVSLEESIRRIVHQKYYQDSDLIQQDGLFHSMDHHGSFSGSDKEKVAKKINASIDTAYAHLIKSKFIFISPGTSWVYRHKTLDHIVGNCHKIPQTQFDKFLLSYEETCNSLENIYQFIKDITPTANIIWTVSPVRHLRDGMAANQKSKATLILATAEMMRRHNDCFYFPAYEIMIDQLRDYRYYADDMIHPSNAAIDIIWELFRENYLDEKDKQLHSMIEKIQLGMQHRFLHDQQKAKNDFAKKQLEQIDKISNLKAGLDFSQERRYFTSLSS
jgi:hypothetical protein